MKAINMIATAAMMALGIATAAQAATSACGDGTYDPVVGTYVGVIPHTTPGVSPADHFTLAFYNGGAAGLLEEFATGAAGEWILSTSANGLAPKGAIAPYLASWTRLGKAHYSVTMTNLAGFPTIDGLFPLNVLGRGVLHADVYLSSDCKSITINSIDVAVYALDDVPGAPGVSPLPPGTVTFGTMPAWYRMK